MSKDSYTKALEAAIDEYLSLKQEIEPRLQRLATLKGAITQLAMSIGADVPTCVSDGIDSRTLKRLGPVDRRRAYMRKSEARSVQA